MTEPSIVDPEYLAQEISRRLCRTPSRRAEAMALIPPAKRAPLGQKRWWLHHVCVPTLRLDELQARLAREKGWQIDVREQVPIELIADVIDYLVIPDLAAAREVLAATKKEWDETIRDYDRHPLQVILEPIAGVRLGGLKDWLRRFLSRSNSRAATSTGVPFLAMLVKDAGPITEVGVVTVRPEREGVPIDVCYLRRPYVAVSDFERPGIKSPRGVTSPAFV